MILIDFAKKLTSSGAFADSFGELALSFPTLAEQTRGKAAMTHDEWLRLLQNWVRRMCLT